MKKNFSLTLLLAFIFFTGFGQTQDAAWKYAETITEPQLKDILTIIASEQMQGRETGTEGQRRAAMYIASKFKEIGLKAPESLGGYLQRYPLYKDSLVNQQVTIAGNKLMPIEDFVLMTGNAINDDVRNDQVVFAGYGIDDKAYSDYKNINVKGKIVVVLNGEPKEGDKFLVSGTNKSSVWAYSVNRKADAATKYGAKGVIFMNPKMNQFPRYIINSATQSSFYFPKNDGSADRVPVAYVLPKYLGDIFPENVAQNILKKYDGQEALNTIKATVKKEVSILYNKNRRIVLASNVIGYIEGTDLKDQYLLLTGHYDHLGMHDGQIYYGADDDGSGTTGVIAMAEAFMKAKKAGNGPRRTVVFMTVSGEEKGLWGSEYYSEHPVFPLDKTSADLNTDMIGRIDPGRKYGDSTNYVYVIGNDKLSSDLDRIAKDVNNKYMKMELDFKFNDPNDPLRIYYRSDHYNFARKGVPIIFYFDGIHDDYHKPSDTVDKINFDLLEKRVRYTFLTGWDIANRDEMLKRDIPLPEGGR